jgi:hypothetical protein
MLILKDIVNRNLKAIKTLGNIHHLAELEW